MSARKLEKFPVQLLSLDAIKVDRDLQSRVSTSIEYQRQFSEAMLRGDVFPPVTVFFDGKVHWLADGFHRYGAAVQVAKENRRRKGAIRAEVRKGSRRDAMIFSAGANIKFSIPRTAEDIKKAVWMLLEDEEWFGKTHQDIAKHCGTSVSSTIKYRAAYCETFKKDMPQQFTDKVGRIRPTRNTRRSEPPRLRTYARSNGQLEYRVNFCGKNVNLGADPEIARQKYDSYVDIWESNHTSINQGLMDWLRREGLNIESIQIRCAPFPHVSGFMCDGSVCTQEDFTKRNAPADPIGRALILKEHVGSPHPPIVVCYPDEGPAEILEIGRRLGIEFLTPEELVARVKGKHPPEPEPPQ